MASASKPTRKSKAPFVALYPSDFIADVAHLSMLELGAYWALLLHYYQHARPLPADVVKCQRLVRATSKDEREAVATVIAEYFKVGTSDGCEEVFRNKRADYELMQAEIRRGAWVAGALIANAKKRAKNAPSDTLSATGGDTPSDTLSVTPGACEPEPEPEKSPPTPPSGGDGGTRPPLRKSNGAWWSNEATAKAKAHEVGVGEARPGETWQAYLQRIREAAERVKRSEEGHP